MNWHTILTLCVVLSLCSCAKDDFDFVVPQADSGLILTPQVYDAVATRAPSDLYDDTSDWHEGDEKPGDDALLENDLGTHLDVFISGIDDSFWKEFHLTKGQNFSGMTANVQDNVADLLSDAWKTLEGNGLRLTVGHRYDVYVAVNTPTTNGTIGSKAALLALVNNNPIVHKLYGSSNDSEYDQSRRMMMDGHVVWTLENDDNIQRIYVPLRRAEAKIALSVKFDAAFYASLLDNYYVDNPIGNTPAWKWVNWCQDSKVFADGPDITPTLVTNEDRNNATAKGVLNHQKYYHYQDANVNVYFTEDEKDPDGNLYRDIYPTAEEKYVDGVPTCNIITYYYCSNWGDEAEAKAPFMLLSYPFYSKESAESSTVMETFNYYRIPVCDEAAHTHLERNHIYKVDAVISGSGSTSLEGRVNPVRLNYQVVEWTHNENEVVNVKAEKFYFFYVTPKRYELRGEGTQTVNLAYYAPANSTVQIKDLRAYYYNSSGTERPTTANVTVDAANEQIVVSSQVLANRAVKYISFTAYTTYVDDEGVSHTLEEKVFVKHFPIDNIQNVEGWFSYKLGGGTPRTIREYSWDPAADGWDSYDGYEDVEVTEAEYEQAVDGKHSQTVERATGTPSNYDRASNIEYGTNNTWVNYFRNAVPQNSRQGANSERNAYKDSDSDYWYWGTGSTQLNNGNNGYDWYSNRRYYRYNTYYRRIYYKTETIYYARRYYRDITINSNWYIRNIDGNYTNTTRTVEDDHFKVKFYENGQLYLLTQNTNWWGDPTTGASASTQTGLNNNHMYILQISRTSEEYILGRPTITNYQSQDHVVSPAFMIASQLGAVTTFSGNTAGQDAATHCGNYVEVAQDGTTYTGWRLPTKEEINVIIGYQSSIPETMAPVLTGQYYWTLDGTSAYVSTGNQGTATNAYVRCIRDLSPAEVNAINSKQ